MKCDLVQCRLLVESRKRERTSTSGARVGWSTHHPENWTTEQVQEWLIFTAERFSFPAEVRVKVSETFASIGGRELMSFTLHDFRRLYERSYAYTLRVNALLETLTSKRKQTTPPIWKMIDVRQWTANETAEWLAHACEDFEIPPEEREILSEKLAYLTGHDLQQMSKTDFQIISYRHGSYLYGHFHGNMASVSSYINSIKLTCIYGYSINVTCIYDYSTKSTCFYDYSTEVTSTTTIRQK
ncbi:hypothetical protein MAR_007959 [Mya arenaria]|uniref:PNT domain-containing protein n=1 Tax=Mya arenaria TaxID=6604 RepID=A0ABY7DXJ0_MYAAR|nr:hypothetical protein MAR_007959 [Mya arenaria]